MLLRYRVLSRQTASMVPLRVFLGGVPQLVFENEYACVINKPAGIVHHSTPEEDGVLKQIRSMQQRGEFSYTGDLFSVHRLDRATSGLLIFAKNKKSARFFSGAFEDRKVSKYYIAISNKRPSKNMGKIIGDIVPSRRSQMKLQRSNVNPSKTRFISQAIANRLDEHFPVSSSEGVIVSDAPDKKESPAAPLRLFLVKPITGQQHQVRVVLKSLGSPVLGDPLYARRDDLLARVDRCYLHACAMRIPMPAATAANATGQTADGASFVQIVCAPSAGDGALFQSSEFRASWKDWVLPNIAPGLTNDRLPESLGRHELETQEHGNSESHLETESPLLPGKSPGKNFSVFSADEPIVWC